jgi:hypothetical protein
MTNITEIGQKRIYLEFKSKKNPGFGLLLLFVGLLVLFLSFGLPFITMEGLNLKALIIKCLISLIVIGFFLWCWLKTCYTIENKTLIVKCGPFRWLISIQEIKMIRLDQKTIGGSIKPTLSWKCIEIDYEHHKTISISPENQDEFLDILQDINQDISIRHYT